jgi:glycosyltransferase involved in cell wall biosynthesis
MAEGRTGDSTGFPILFPSRVSGYGEKSMIDISVVIPTRNRVESLCRCLSSLAAQSHPLGEVIIVDASEQRLDKKALTERFPKLNLIVLNTTASVCAQRNKGIQAARGSHILLSDDDIEFPPNYSFALSDFLAHHPSCGATSGVLIESLGGTFKETILQEVTQLELCWRFLFQLTLWTDISRVQPGLFSRVVLQWMKQYYRNRNNTFTLGGWPLVTQVNGDHFRTAIFGLGAALVRREWLLASPFDETIDPHGIGDNYGVAINFPGDLPIVVLRGVSAIHYRSDIDRLPETTTYFRRILALHYFMRCSKRFTRLNRLVLLWSLLGNLIPQVLRLDFNRARATLKAGLLISTGRNPYLNAALLGVKNPIAPNP